jgi:hypothetical protein
MRAGEWVAKECGIPGGGQEKGGEERTAVDEK